ncbi:UNVERIFIED_CONTAM: hypothetical protein Slati_2251200 [Sesamum latifolium]|uniref:Myb/SANT-like domain-containing protein n=1 Tax=Sesamum latifolium TaxID=2727402 RepID=A0AAW2WUK6_9LAMI
MNPSEYNEVQSSQRRRGAGKEKGGSRRTWTAKEEEVLVNALKSIVASGWKCDNGFCNGYLLPLEAYMLNALPSSDIRSEPYINSKIHVWKKQYSTLISMMTKSGFGWDESRNMITVVVPAYGMIMLSIARGERQTTPEPDNVPTADCNPEHGFVSNNEDEAPFPNINIDSTSASTNAHKESSGSGSKKRHRRVGVDAEERLEDMVGTFCKEANSRISSLTKVLEREFGNEKNSDV